MRMPSVWMGMVLATDGDETDGSFNGSTADKCSRPRLSRAVDPIFEAGQLLGADRAAGVEFAGGNPSLSAEADFAAFRELRRGLVQHDRRFDLVEEPPREVGFLD